LKSKFYYGIGKNNKIIFFGIVDGEKKYYTLNYNSSSKIDIKNMLSNNNSFCKPSDNLNNKKDANININTTKKILEKIYKIYPSNDKKFKKIMIGNAYIQNCIF